MGLSLEEDAEARSVADRLSRFQRTRDFRALWPDFSRSSLIAAQHVIERVARDILAGREPLPLYAADPDALGALRLAAYLGGTGALLGRWIEDGRLAADAATDTLFRTELHRGRERADRITRGVLPALDALLAQGITPVVLKGMHTARVLHEEPGVRPVADVDLLVPGHLVSDAEAALAGAGFLPTQPLPRPAPYKRHWRAAGVEGRYYSIDGMDARNPWEIDLHVSWNREMFWDCATLDGVGHLVPFILEGRPLLAPAHPLLLHVLAVQAGETLRSLRLMRTLEVVRAVRDPRTPPDWNEMISSIRANGAARFIYPALELAEFLSPGCIAPDVYREVRSATPWLARVAMARLAPGGGLPGEASVALQVLSARGLNACVRLAARRLVEHASLGPAHLTRTLARLIRLGRGLRILPRRERA